MSIVKIFLAVAISVASVISASAAGEHGLITLKSGEQIEAPEVWYTHGQAIYLMGPKQKKVVLEDSEVEYVQFYDEEKKDFGPKIYSDYVISYLEFIKDNPKMPKEKKSILYKLMEQEGYILYMCRSWHTDKYGFRSEIVYYYFKKPEWPWAVEMYPINPLRVNNCNKFWKKMFEDNSTMTKTLNDNSKDFISSYFKNAKAKTDFERLTLMYISLFNDYIETRDKK